MKTWLTRWDFIAPYVDGKRMLEIGPAELVGTTNAHKKDTWIHGRLAETASRVVGLEKNAEQVRALSAQGYDIREGDAESFQLGESFEVVLAGELIEHLSNPGHFLDRTREHLEEGGILLLTTPNRYSVRAILKLMRTGAVPRYDKPIAKHVAYYDSDGLESLLVRHGYSIVEVGYCMWVGTPSRSRYVRWLLRWVRFWRPTMLPVLVAVARK